MPSFTFTRNNWITLVVLGVAVAFLFISAAYAQTSRNPGMMGPGMMRGMMPMGMGMMGQNMMPMGMGMGGMMQQGGMMPVMGQEMMPMGMMGRGMMPMGMGMMGQDPGMMMMFSLEQMSCVRDAALVKSNALQKAQQDFLNAMQSANDVEAVQSARDALFLSQKQAQKSFFEALSDCSAA